MTIVLCSRTCTCPQAANQMQSGVLTAYHDQSRNIIVNTNLTFHKVLRHSMNHRHRLGIWKKKTTLATFYRKWESRVEYSNSRWPLLCRCVKTKFDEKKANFLVLVLLLKIEDIENILLLVGIMLVRSLLSSFSYYYFFLYLLFFNWGSLHARLNSHYEAWSYKKGSTQKITWYRKSV